MASLKLIHSGSTTGNKPLRRGRGNSPSPGWERTFLRSEKSQKATSVPAIRDKTAAPSCAKILDIYRLVCSCFVHVQRSQTGAARRGAGGAFGARPLAGA